MDSPSEAVRTPAEVFAYLQSRFHKERISNVCSYTFIVEDETWVMEVGPDACAIERGAPESESDCVLETSRELFLNIFNREYTPSLMDFINGRIKCNKPELLLTLKKVFGND